MVTITPDKKSVEEILSSVAEAVRYLQDSREGAKIIALTPYNWVGCMHGMRACTERHAMPLATYKRSKAGISVEYTDVVKGDDRLFAQFEEALRVALLNVFLPAAKEAMKKP